MGISFSSAALQKGVMPTLVREQAARPLFYVPRLCEIVVSDGQTEVHEQLDEVPSPETWTGSRKVRALTGRKQTVTNEVRDGSFRIQRDHLRWNRSGSYIRKMRQLMARTAAFHDTQIASLITGGESGVYNDDAATDDYFFDDTHAVHGLGATYDNLLAGAGTSVANIQSDLAADVLPYFGSVKDGAGELFHTGNLRLIIVCPRALEMAMRDAVESPLVSSSTNVYLGIAEVYADGRLDATDVNDWYCFVDDPTARPFIFQIESDWEEDYIGADSELYVNERQVQVGVSGCFGYDYLYPQSACKVVNT